MISSIEHTHIGREQLRPEQKGFLYEVTDAFRDTLINAPVNGALALEDCVQAPVFSLERQLENGMYIHAAEAERQGLSSLESMAGAAFEPDFSAQVTTTDSMHHVVFGDLIVDGEPVSVAIKNFNSYPAVAIRDYMANLFMAKQGYESFRPLGLLVSPNNTFFISIRERVTTLNTISWKSGARDFAPGPMTAKGHELATYLDAAYEQLGSMHARGIFHGNAEPKNVAVSQRGVIGFIDFESLRYQPDSLPENGDASSLFALSQHDTKDMYLVLRKRYGFLAGCSPEQRYETFWTVCIEPYMQSLLREGMDRDAVGNIMQLNRDMYQQYIIEQDH